MNNIIPDPRQLVPSLATIQFAYTVTSKLVAALINLPVPVAEVFLRREFGAARLGNFSWLNAPFLFLIGWLLSGIVALLHPHQAATQATLGFLIAASILCVWHEYVIQRAMKARGPLIAAEPHVKYEGVPWLAWLFRKPQLAAPSMLLLEPALLVFAIPWLIESFDPVFAGLMRWLGIATFVAGLRAFSERHKNGESVADWAKEVMQGRGRMP
ncbi:MAG: hypothetical protein KF841_13915 [Phycisphaerae bacterium]|nr:hypothetical protein [Phycisphaerae bacterium]